ncbi:6-O-methylguanine DNA methyltransferase [Crucibulum laeve]|uniref:Methylated-DNA--protein-cysteine methyltransferase n=1 Tax=Crucibulum laeve TaxID=68775 RepID=A0A5C3LQR8_9AGAR|nr:6-O-methylguanine DNA methyltransferase [Crucibulum laeve]
MPVKRLDKEDFAYTPTHTKELTQYLAKRSSADFAVINISQSVPRDLKTQEPLSFHECNYPTTDGERTRFRTKAGKRLTTHQWAVYDFALTIPCGKVTTYKDISSAIGGSPRSVGSALRNNPFAPYVPCHRVIASSLFIGGFLGEWGKEDKTGTRCNQKLDLLEREGVSFSKSGHLLDSDNTLWRG